MEKFFGKIKTLCKKYPIETTLILVCFVAVTVTVIVLTALLSQPKLTKIEIVTPPTKTEYIEGQDVDTAGLVVKAYYGKKSNVIDDYYLDKKQVSFGDDKIVVSYAGGGNICSADIPITVVRKGLVAIEITQLPDKLAYVEGAQFDPSGMAVTASYNNGRQENISDWQIDKADPLQLGDTAVSVSYGGLTIQVSISVEAKVLLSVYMRRAPQKLSYFEGEYFDFLGVEICAKYGNAADELIKDWDYDKKEQLTTADGAVEFSFALHGVTKTVSADITVQVAPDVDEEREFVQKVLDLLPPAQTMSEENLPEIEYALSLLDRLDSPTPEQSATKQTLEAKRDEIVAALPPESEREYSVVYKIGGGLNFEDVDFTVNPDRYKNSDGAVALSPAVSQIADGQGYVFNGWLLDGQVVDKLQDLASNVVIFADFKLTATLTVEFVDRGGSSTLLQQQGVTRTAAYDLQAAGIDTLIYLASGRLPVAYYAQDGSRISAADLSAGKIVTVYVVTAQARELHIDGNKGASVGWTYDFSVAGADEQTSHMPDVGNVFVIPIGAAVKVVAMNANINDIIVDGTSMGEKLNNTVVQAEFVLEQGQYAVSVTFSTVITEMSTLSFLGYNQHSVVYPAGWDGVIADVDLDNIKFIYDEDNVNYVTQYFIDGEIYYLDGLAKYVFDGDTQIYVKRVRNSFSLTVIYAGGQEKLDGLVGKQSLGEAISGLPQDALSTLTSILADGRLFSDAQQSQSISEQELLSATLRSDVVVYSGWERPAPPAPTFDEVDYSGCAFVGDWSALFAKDADVLSSQLTLSADGVYCYRTYVNGSLSADISGIYRIEDGKVALKTLRLNYQYQLAVKEDVEIDVAFAEDGLLRVTFVYLEGADMTLFEHTVTCGDIRPVNYTNKEFIGTYDLNGAEIELRENGTARIIYQGVTASVVYRVTDDGRLYIFDNGDLGTGEIKGILEEV